MKNEITLTKWEIGRLRFAIERHGAELKITFPERKRYAALLDKLSDIDFAVFERNNITLRW